MLPEHSIYYFEIVTNDVQTTCSLYAEAYGWRFQQMGPELGNSLVAELPGGSLCGIRAPLTEQERPIVRTYLKVSDIQKAVKDVKRLGAMVALEPTEIPGHGQIGIFIQGGIEQGLWQNP